MPKYQPVSRAQFADRRWRRFSSYAFAAGDMVAPLVAQELPRATMHLPVGFMQFGDTWLPVALLGLGKGRNLFVAPDGRWAGPYVPAVYRSYPFTLVDSEEGKQVLCVDAESELIGDEGEPFFDDEGSPAKPVAEVLNFLGQVRANRAATVRACSALAAHGLIQPWPISIKHEGGEQPLQGLYRIDEAALNTLPAAAFEEVRQAGSLPLAYCQLLSMQHLGMLGELAQAHARVAQPAASLTDDNGDLNLDFLNGDDNIRFN